MKLPPQTRVTLAGITLAALAMVGGRNAWNARAPKEPAPMEEILASEVVDSVVAAEVSWDLPGERNERVEFWIDFLAGRNHDKTRLWLERSTRYAPLIQQELRARGMPQDLLYFAMIESGFSNRAYSRASAVGMWQFIAETGKRYGLDVTPYVDERRDPVEATRAALDYLVYMHRDFGSWYLAAAGYNSGENRVRRILRDEFGGARGDEDLYWRMADHLPRETRDYVPLMLAAGHIAKDPVRYGFADLEYQAPLSYEEVPVPGATPLEAVARAAGVPVDTVAELNPHLVRSMTPPGGDYRVRIPVGTRMAFQRNFARMEEEVRVAGVEHQLGRGETLSHVARRYGVTLASLEQANAGMNPRRLQVGQVIRVPAPAADPSAAPADGSVESGGDPAAAGWSRYRVRPGDSLWEIARRHRVSVRELRAWNGLGSRSTIQPGQTLRIRV